MQNPSFENGTNNWSWSGGTLYAGGGAVKCGSYSGDFEISNTSSNWVSQTIGTDLPVGTVINASTYAGTLDNSYYHEVGVYFFDANWNWISGASVEVNKVLANSPAGPQLYTWTAIVPVGTKYTQVGYSGNGSWIKTDQWCVTLASGTTVAFGNQLFVDLNGNGKKDGSDWGYDGVTVKLYADANEDGVADGAALATTATSGGGFYNFANLVAGKYLAQIENAPSWMYVIPKNGGDPDNNIDDDNNGLSQSGTTIKGGTITLSVGGEPGSSSYNSTYDFAVYKTNGLGDYVFLDANANGIQDAGEGGIAGVTVKLRNSSGTVLATTTTDANGYYAFYDPAQYGTYSYQLQFITPAGYTPSPSNQGSDDNKDSDPVSGIIPTFTVPDGTWNNSFDAGFYLPIVNLGDKVWYDLNNNGVQDAGEPVISGATVKLYADANGDNTPDGAAIATTTTNTSGLYAFSSLTPGKYIVGVTIPTGYSAGVTLATSASPDNDNNTDNNGVTTVSGELRSNFITLTAGGEPTTDGDGNNGNLTLDFGLKGTGSIGDFVWNDLNGNGIQDAGEPGISGATVTLTYPNGSTATTTTDANGAYSFANLAPGTYSVSFTTPSGYTSSPANLGGDDTKDSDPVSGVVSGIVLTAGQNNTTIDAGFQSNQLNIGNYVWYDLNNNGVQDAGEPVISGATVNLYKDANGDNVPDGAAVATTTTSASGLYSFTGLTPGNYIAGVVIPAGYVAGATTGTSSLPNNDNNTDNNGVTTVSGELRSNFITLTTGGEPATGVDGDGTNGNLTLDFGLKGTASLGDFVWNDLNGNGVQDAGEPGISGATVTLTYPNGSTATTTTDANGAYSFANLAPGTYSVSFTTPSGYTSSPANLGGDDTKDSDPVSGVVSGIVLTAGQNNTTIDAGFQSNQLNLGNYVWYDRNNNGVQDAGETGISGVSAKLYKDADGNNIPDGAALATTTTDAGGLYSFSGLTPGNYIVGITAPAGYAMAFTTASSLLPNNDNNTDNNGITIIASEITSNFVTLTTGGEPAAGIDGDGTNGNLTLDFGLKGTASIGDYVWHDLNGNGIQDAGEPGISGATVTLTYPGGATTSITTDANGAYDFSNLAPGSYSVTFSSPAGYTPATSNAGTDDAKDSDPVSGVVSGISLAAGQNNTTIDAGFYQPLNLGNYVWYDRNNNGTQDAGEPVVSGATVNLYADANGDNTPDGAAIATTTTNAGGLYSFSSLAPGNYIVGVVIPAGYTASVTTATSASPNNDNNTDNNGVTNVGGELRSNSITLVSGAEPTADGDGNNGNLTLDFGLKGTASIGDFVWNDLNGNGIQDAGEPGISGATVTLTYAGGFTATVTTDANGAYSFTGLAPGTYSVSFTTPSGYIPSPSDQGSDDSKDSDPVSGVVSGIVLTAGQNNTTIDAGFQSNQLNLGDKVWYDQNNNGVQDANETGINGATANLYKDANGDNVPDGASVATTTTNASGVYSFSGLTPANYIVGVVIPAGYTAAAVTATSSLPNNDNNTDNNGVTTVGSELRSNFITLTTGGEPASGVDGDGTNGNLTLDFGLKGTASLGDFVWNDLNGNGVQDAGEPGISGATVTLTYPNGAAATTTTDANGAYSFVNLIPGTYSVSFTTPSGFIPSPANLGDDTKDSDPVSGVVSGIVLTAGQNNTTIDAGFQSNQLNLGNYVWYDKNNNGIQDAGEAGINGVSVKLYKDSDGNNIPDGAALVTTTTNASGVYSFGGLTPGNYIVGITAPAGYAMAFTTASSLLPNNDNNTDNNGITIIGTEITSNFITLTTLSEPTTDGDGSNGNLTLDFGLKGTGTIGDFVWNDLDGDGFQDAGEPGIGGASVTLTYPDGTTISTTTDANGGYSFTNLAPGTYSVSFITPSGFVSSPANQGGDDSKDSDPVAGVVSGINLSAGQINLTIDAGFQSNQLVLGNYVWYDKNNNGVQDAGETPIANATVRLYADANGDNAPDGAAVANTSTNANGEYSFTGLTPGNYIVGVVPPAGYTASATTGTSTTPDNDNNTDNNGVAIVSGEIRSNHITLTTLGEPTTDGDGSNGNLTLDFGLTGTGSLGNFVWRDLNNNGLQDAGEPGISGVAVALTNPDGSIVNTTTDANGAYQFTNLIPGTYSVVFSTPSGYIPATANAGSNDAIDSDPIGGIVSGITLSAGESNQTIDAGFRKLVNLSGNVWHDVNALEDNLVNNTGPLQTPPASVIPTGLRAYLVNASTGLVERVAFVNSTTGTYSFANINPNTVYFVYLSFVSSGIGVPPPAALLPEGWEHTGQKLGITPGSDGINEGRLTVPVSSSDVINANFGIRTSTGEVVIG